MSLSDCPRCYDTPCTCGYSYWFMDQGRLEAVARAASKVLGDRRGGRRPPIAVQQEMQRRGTRARAADFDRRVAMTTDEVLTAAQVAADVRSAQEREELAEVRRHFIDEHGVTNEQALDEIESLAAAANHTEDRRARAMYQGALDRVTHHLAKQVAPAVLEVMRWRADGVKVEPDTWKCMRCGEVYGGVGVGRAKPEHGCCTNPYCPAALRASVARDALASQADPNPDPTCGSCPHPPHVGACTRRSGQTAYACGCIRDTVPETWRDHGPYQGPIPQTKRCGEEATGGDLCDSCGDRRQWIGCGKILP